MSPRLEKMKLLIPDKSQQLMTNKTYKQLEMEPYVEHGIAKLRYKEALTKEMFPEEAQDLAEALIKAIGS